MNCDGYVIFFPLCIQATICFRCNDCYKSQNEVSNPNTCLEQRCWCYPANKAYFLKQQQVTYHCVIQPGDTIAAYAGHCLGHLLWAAVVLCLETAKAEGTVWRLTKKLHHLTCELLNGTPRWAVWWSELVHLSPIALLWASNPPEWARDPGPVPGLQGLRGVQAGETWR